MSTIHFEYKEIIPRERSHGWGTSGGLKKIGCGENHPTGQAVNLDKVTCGRCKRSRSYKAYRAFVMGLIDKKMLNQIGLVVSGKLA